MVQFNQAFHIRNRAWQPPSRRWKRLRAKSYRFSRFGTSWESPCLKPTGSAKVLSARRTKHEGPFTLHNSGTSEQTALNQSLKGRKTTLGNNVPCLYLVFCETRHIRHSHMLLAFILLAGTCQLMERTPGKTPEIWLQQPSVVSFLPCAGPTAGLQQCNRSIRASF